MKRPSTLIILFSLALLVAAPGAEGPSTQQQEQQIITVAKQVQDQQAAIADNQVKIEAKLAAIAENLRVARIYSSRGGGK